MRVHQASFEPVPQSAKAARDFLRECLAGSDVGVDTDMILLLGTELVTNAILHTRLTFEVTVELTTDCAQVCVDDLSAIWPAPAGAADDETNGRGLAIVEAGADRWGIIPTAHGKRAWFEICV